MRRYALGLLLLGGCTQEDIAAVLADGSTPSDAGVSDADAIDAGELAYCEGSGPPLIVGDTGLECAGRLAERAFRFAVCVCEDLAASHLIRSDAYDSRQGPYTQGRPGGSLGANGRIAASAGLELGGSLYTSDADGLSSGGVAVEVQRRLFSAGAVSCDGPLRVGEDAFVAGSVRASELVVGQTLTLPNPNEVFAPVQNVGQIQQASVAVNEPCGCQDPIDIQAYVARHEQDNDNAEVDLDPEDFANVLGTQNLQLPCGRYYLNRIAGSGSLTLQLQGRVALFVGADLALSSLDLTLEPGAELDLFVGGQLVAQQNLQLGNADEPVRLYVGGSGTIQLDAGAVLGGHLYAPRAELVSAGPVEVFGSIFARRLAISGPLDVHYDTAVSAAGEDCLQPRPTQCTPCGCGLGACVDGVCGACETNDDCCAPLACVAGQCLPEF